MWEGLQGLPVLVHFVGATGSVTYKGMVANLAPPTMGITLLERPHAWAEALPVVLEIVRGEDRYRYHGHAHSQPDQPEHLVVAVRGEPELYEHRRAPRVVLAAPVRVSVTSPAPDSWPADCLDLSPGGMAFVTDSALPLDVGQEVGLEIRLPRGGDVNVRAQILRLDVAGRWMRVGACFVDLTPQQREAMQEWARNGAPG